MSDRRKPPRERSWADKVGTPRMIELGNRIRERRIAAGLTAEQAGKGAGNHSARTWWHWECGERAMAVEQFLNICALFHVAPAELLAGLELSSPVTYDLEIQRASTSLLRDFWQLNQRDRTAVRRVIKALLERERKNFQVIK